ncbi:hypothetical protein Ctob_001555 [Chrysochromulina tobinii]|uniref:Rieske domain-containing protein n=1 Tax=Chrysochromulina tobinii TaxID=1460289 RepID=A0A0M0JC92_9EUKA|nr:hypothetical protein Ctob_001555 [Chrysochromulina tobinii]|eukprot:KOO24216.1 hypothetical protein Ctob_001555 [Chrysochromulina sp. CCMP291]
MMDDARQRSLDEAARTAERVRLDTAKKKQQADEQQRRSAARRTKAIAALEGLLATALDVHHATLEELLDAFTALKAAVEGCRKAGLADDEPAATMESGKTAATGESYSYLDEISTLALTGTGAGATGAGASATTSGAMRSVRVTLGQRTLAIYSEVSETGAETLYAIDADCPHQGAALEAGDIEEVNGAACVVCPRHGWCFDLKTGWRTVQATTSIGPNCKRLEQEVRERYGDQELADKVVLILKMALGLFAYGQPSVDVEMFCLEASLRFGVPAPYVSIGPRVLTASFGSHPPHLLECGRDIVCSYLADLHTLAVMITRGEANDAPTALYVCDQLLKRPRPYGWLIQLVAFECIAILAVPVVLPGSYQDMPGAALICASLLLTMQLGKVLGIAHLEIMYISFAVGAAAPLVWYYVSNSGQPLCHIGPQYIGPLIIHLPGCQFIWAALELAQGSMVHGTARLVNAMFQVMLMAIFITLGWQIFGRDWARGSASIIPMPGQSSTGPIASLPPSLWCPVPSSIPWYVSQGIWALPLVLFLNVHLNIRLRESLAPIACTLVGTLTNGFLRDGCTAETCSMPVDLRNVLVAFVTASAAESLMTA